MSTPVRVLVVDDQPPFRMAAGAVIARTPGFVLAGESESGEQAILDAERLQPDLVLIDFHLPGISGVDAAEEIGKRFPRTLVVLCSTYALADLPIDRARPVSYLPKAELSPQALTARWAEARVKLS